VVRVPSLLSIGVSQEELLAKGLFLLNMQMAGMIVGGVLWGILGDKRGRKSVLFGSILLYSIATLSNGFVNSLPLYAILRLLAGIGLAGEVGAAMTIAAEVTPKKYRAYGTAAVAGLGVAGELLASYVGGILPWRMAFITAGVGGLVLLLARMSMKETILFERAARNASVERGNFMLLLMDKDKIMRVLRCSMAAVPLWFAVITSTAEQFGTNLRSTATTLVPNMVRASTIPITLVFGLISSNLGTLNAALITGCLCFFGAAISIAFMDETFGKDLDFIEI